MKSLSNYLSEKLHVSQYNKEDEDRKKILFDELEALIKSDDNAVIFDNKEIRETYSIANLTISFDYKYDYIMLDHLLIKDKKQGHGTQFMQDLCDFCDIHNKKLCLTPTNDFGSHLGRLKKFYKRFGFKENKGQHTDFTTKATMIRKPNNK